MRMPFLIVIPAVVACASSGESPPVADQILVLGGDMGVLFENINLSKGNVPLTGAAVLVNGTVIPETQSGHYAGQLPAPLSAGASIQIQVVAGIDTVIGTTRVPDVPTLVTPSGGATIQIGTPLAFTWTDATNPDEFVAAIQYSGLAEVSGYGPTFRSGIVVTSRIPSTATNMSAFFAAYGDGTFSGPAQPGSKMHVRQAAVPVRLTFGP